MAFQAVLREIYIVVPTWNLPHQDQAYPLQDTVDYRTAGISTNKILFRELINHSIMPLQPLIWSHIIFFLMMGSQKREEDHIILREPHD